MANHIFIMATVMLLADIFGGLVNYYLYGEKDSDASSLPRFLFRSLTGLYREVNQNESTVLKILNVLIVRSLAGKVSGKECVLAHFRKWSPCFRINLMSYFPVKEF
jgi:hypothetical protein